MTTTKHLVKNTQYERNSFFLETKPNISIPPFQKGEFKMLSWLWYGKVHYSMAGPYHELFTIKQNLLHPRTVGILQSQYLLRFLSSTVLGRSSSGA